MSDSLPLSDGGGSAETTPAPGASSDDIGALIDSMTSDADASSASAPAEPADPSAAAPTSPPAASSDVVPPEPGPIPFARHKDILEHERQEREALRAKFAWADAYDPTQVAEGVKLREWLMADPQGMLDALGRQLRQQAPTPEESMQPLLKAEDGTAAYSAEQVQHLLAKQARELKAEIEREYGPIKTKEQLRDLEQQSQAQARTMVAEMRSWPMFKDYEADVKALMAADRNLPPYQAYLRVLQEKALPSVETKIRSQYEGALKDKAAAATTRPGPQPATPVNYREMTTRDIAASVLDALEGPTR